jgi:DNA-binding CsgD family transcriptional regulator/tetratricopeptide (TPR) repeat protein
LPSRSSLVGREREMETLGRLLEHAIAGRGSVALIEGEPGIGKTRLLGETLAIAGALGFAVLRGAGEEMERDRPFGPIAAALGLRRDAEDPRRSDIARLLRTGYDGESREGGPGLRYRVLESVLDLVEDSSASRPIALGLDDLHWADASTLLVVRHLAPRLSSLPVVLLMTSRPVPRTSALAVVLETLRGAGLVQVALGPLSADEVAEVAGSVINGTPSPGLLAQLSGAAGNPLLVTELAFAVQEVRSGAGDQGEARGPGLPSTFADAVLRRLRFLSAETFHVLRHASVLGSVFSVADLALLSARPATDLLAPLDEARSARLLEEVDDRLRFRHDLVRDAVYADLPVSARKELHAHAARVLGAAGRSALQVAAHVTRSATLGDGDAVMWLRAAARESLELAPAVAAELLEQARDLAGPTSAGPQLLDDLITAYVWSGRLAEAESLGSQLLAANRAELTDNSRVALARALMFQGRASEGLTILESALGNAGTDSERAPLLAMGTILRVVVGDVENARILGEESVRVAERAGDSSDEALSLVYLAMAERATGGLRRAVELASRAIDVARRSRSGRPQLVNVYNLAALLLVDVDRMEEAETALQIGRQLAEEHGIVWGQAQGHVLLAERLLHMGHWDDAIAEAETTVDLCETFGTWHAFGMAKSILALVAIHRNEVQRAERHIATARDRLASAPVQHMRSWVDWVTGLVLEADGDLQGALRSYVAAWTACEGVVPDEAMFGPDLVRLAVDLGERRLAAETTTTLEAGADTVALPRIEGAATLCRGLLDDRGEALEASIEAARASARPYDLARVCEATGALLGRTGAREGALTHLRESAEIFEGLGATRDAARVSASLRALGAPRGRHGPRARPNTGWDSLTLTESSVVQLVADGLRNRDIAERLSISRRTVETHLTHVFGKVGVASRTELVARSRQFA